MKFKSFREYLAYVKEQALLWRRRETSALVALHALVDPIEYLPAKDGGSSIWIWDALSRSEEMAWRESNRAQTEKSFGDTENASQR